MSISLALWLWLLNYASGQYDYCDYTEYVGPGQSVNVESPDYPRNYSAGEQCRWTVNCLPGYNLLMYCSDITLPQSPSCSGDRLIVSRSGDSQLNAAETYCGQRTVTILSTGQKLVIALKSTRNNDENQGGFLAVNLGGQQIIGDKGLIRPVFPGSRRPSGGRFTCRVTAQRVNSSSCSCGIRGQNGESEYPMIAGVVHRDEDESDIICSGVIISNKMCLTSASCIANRLVDDLALVVDKRDDTLDESSPNYYKIQSYIIHPQYDMTLANDGNIALLTTKNAIVFSEFVGPACLPFKFVDKNFTRETVTAISWDLSESFSKKTSTELMKIDVTVTPCRGPGLGTEPGPYQASSAASSSQVAVEESFEQSICTSKPFNLDTCRYAAGGPLLFTDKDTGRLFVDGIMNIGVGCEPPPALDVHTKVTPYLSWVEANSPGVDYCRI